MERGRAGSCIQARSFYYGLDLRRVKKCGREQYYEIHEEMAGYHDLLKVLPNRLPKFTLDWLLDVAFPAFEAKHQIIWKRSPEPEAPGNSRHARRLTGL